MAFILILGILTVVFSLPLIFYLLAIQETIKLVQEKHRKLAVWQVWLGVVPLLNIMWQYLIVANLMDSLYAEFRSRKAKYPLNKMKKMGSTYCVLIFLTIIPSVGFLFWIVGIIYWIIFWKKVNEVKKALESLPLYSEFGNKDEDSF